MANCYVKAYYDWIEQTAALSDAERGRLFTAILEYGRSGLEPKLDGRESILFPVFKATLDRDNKKAKTLSENGSKGGRPKKANESKGKQIKANESKRKPTKDKDKDKDKEEEKECYPPTPLSGAHTPKRFTPPTVAEVEAYCRERGNRVDANRFVDFYTGKGWMIGKSPMKDWKAAVRTWENGDNKPQAGKTPKAQELDEFYNMVGNWAAEREA